MPRMLNFPSDLQLEYAIPNRDSRSFGKWPITFRKFFALMWPFSFTEELFELLRPFTLALAFQSTNWSYGINTTLIWISLKPWTSVWKYSFRLWIWYLLFSKWLFKWQMEHMLNLLMGCWWSYWVHPFLEFFWVFWVFNPFYNKQLVNILEGSVLLYILFILDTKYSMFNRSKTKSIREMIIRHYSMTFRAEN